MKLQELNPFQLAEEMMQSVGMKKEYTTDEEIEEQAKDIMDEVMTKLATYLSEEEMHQVVDQLEKDDLKKADSILAKKIPQYEQVLTDILKTYVTDFQQFMGNT